MNYGDLIDGMVVGAVLTLVFSLVTRSGYRQTLLNCARAKTPEKLPDSHFYYLVREDEYNYLKRCERVLKAIREGIASDRCDGESEYASGVNAACKNHLELFDDAFPDTSDESIKQQEIKDGQPNSNIGKK
jgi:hypothetical protein